VVDVRVRVDQEARAGHLARRAVEREAQSAYFFLGGSPMR
jgi:hypothetical protein